MKLIIHYYKQLACLAVFLAIAVIVADAALSYAGFGVCMTEMRWLNEEEQIEAAVSQHMHGRRVRTGDHRTGYRYYDAIPYKNVQAFLSQHPGCCRIGARDFGDGIPEASTAARLMGHANVLVSLSYDEKYYDEHKNVRTHPVKALYAVSDCGTVLADDFMKTQ